MHMNFISKFQRRGLCMICLLNVSSSPITRRKPTFNFPQNSSISSRNNSSSPYNTSISSQGTSPHNPPSAISGVFQQSISFPPRKLRPQYSRLEMERMSFSLLSCMEGAEVDTVTRGEMRIAEENLVSNLRCAVRGLGCVRCRRTERRRCPPAESPINVMDKGGILRSLRRYWRRETACWSCRG